MELPRSKSTNTSNSVTLKEKYWAAQKAYHEAREEMLRSTEECFREQAKYIFERFPTIDSFGWLQLFDEWNGYVFLVRDSLLYINDGRFRAYKKDDDCRPDWKGATDAILGLIRFLDHSILRDLYRDNTRITIRRGGFIGVDRYDAESGYIL